MDKKKTIGFQENLRRKYSARNPKHNEIAKATDIPAVSLRQFVSKGTIGTDYAFTLHNYLNDTHPSQLDLFVAELRLIAEYLDSPDCSEVRKKVLLQTLKQSLVNVIGE